jgi:hypothetical protein
MPVNILDIEERLVWEIEDYWAKFREPMSLVLLARRYGKTIRCSGHTLRSVLDKLLKSGTIYELLSRRGARYVYLISQWNSMSAHEQEMEASRLEYLNQERARAKREGMNIAKVLPFKSI